MNQVEEVFVEEYQEDEDVEYVVTEEDGSFDQKQYGKVYYSKNMEKSRAYNREYSARLRADPVKREALNAQKRQMMRRLAERRREAKLSSGNIKIESGSTQDNLSDSSSTSRTNRTPARKNHKEYYELNKEKMRISNRKYSAKIRSDPEKRLALNEKKKLAMRRLKERRLMEAQPAVMYEVIEVPPEQVPKYEVGEDSTMEAPEQEEIEEIEEDANQNYGIIETEGNVGEEVVIREDEEEEEQEHDQETIEVPGMFEEEIMIEEPFPNAINTLRSIPTATEQSKFVAYMERCAREYFASEIEEEVDL